MDISILSITGSQDTAKSVRKETKNFQNVSKMIQRHQKLAKRRSQNIVQKRPAQGRQPQFGGLGPERLFDELIAKMWNCEAKIDAKTNQQSMQNHVEQMKLIKNILFMWTILKFIVAAIVFEDLEGCVRERKRYQPPKGPHNVSTNLKKTVSGNRWLHTPRGLKAQRIVWHFTYI